MAVKIFRRIEVLTRKIYYDAEKMIKTNNDSSSLGGIVVNEY